MIFVPFAGRDPSWIIIAVAFIQDNDFGLNQLRNIPGITLSFTVRHGDFHNIMALVYSPLLLLRLCICHQDADFGCLRLRCNRDWISLLRRYDDLKTCICILLANHKAAFWNRGLDWNAI